MKARDLMISPVITVEQHATVRDAAALLRDKHISAVPVVDRDGKLVGILSEADLIRRHDLGTERSRGWLLEQLASADTLAAAYAKSHAIHVKDVMTTKVHTARPTTPLEQVAELMERYHVKRIPITSDAGDLVGILCRANIVQAVATARPGLQIAPTDAAIRTRLMTELEHQCWCDARQINATVESGVVDLWGVAHSDQERQAIRVAAESIPGVLAVNDHLMLAHFLIER